MFKIICEECGNEITINNGYDLTAHEVVVRGGYDGDVSIDCEVCKKSIDNFRT